MAAASAAASGASPEDSVPGINIKINVANEDKSKKSKKLKTEGDVEATDMSAAPELDGGALKPEAAPEKVMKKERKAKKEAKPGGAALAELRKVSNEFEEDYR